MQSAYLYACPTWIKVKSQEEIYRGDTFPELSFSLCDRHNIVLSSPYMPCTICVAALSALEDGYDPHIHPATSSEILVVTNAPLSTHRLSLTSSIPEHPQNREGQLPFQSLREDLGKPAIGAITPLLQMHHARAQLSCQT